VKTLKFKFKLRHLTLEEMQTARCSRCEKEIACCEMDGFDFNDPLNIDHVSFHACPSCLVLLVTGMNRM